MTMNESYSEHLRQLETIRRNNQAAQNRVNKYVLIVAGILFTFVSVMLLLNHLNVLHLS
jgi:hypothetical protein